MNIVVVGLSHKTASVEIREKVAFAPNRMEKPLREALALPDITEALIVSSCNRVEIYATTHVIAAAMARL
jgi:glutamyl-tRNA reductase